MGRHSVVTPARPARRVGRRGGLIALATAATLAAVPAAIVSASAAAAPSPMGILADTTQNTYTHAMHVNGWAYDRSATSAKVTVRVYVDGRYVGSAATTHSTPVFNKTHHISGTHGFDLSFTWSARAGTVTVYSTGAPATGTLHKLTSLAAKHSDPTAGQRIIGVAKKYVGHAKYREGGASPTTGFDCSGYTMYVFQAAKVATLPHNAESQRRMSRMYRVAASSARAGDLVFYLSGSSAYHVAIYAGGGMQYAAATPQDGIRYQRVWSSAVQYYRWAA